MHVAEWNGEPISRPGWYSGISIERYHSANICDGIAVSSSDLRTCWLRSPAHMFAKWAENPKAEERDVTRPMILGQAAHHLLLGEDHFDLKFVAQPETYTDKKTGEVKPWTYNANVCKDWRSKQHEAGREVVTVKELDVIVGISRSLALEPLVNEGLLKGHVECSGFFKDEETGLWLKVRPDVVPVTGDDFIDLKTATDVTTIALMSSIRVYSYHQQGALVWEVCEGLEHPFDSFTLMFTETANPFCARMVPLPEEDLKLGREQNRLMLRWIKECIETNHFPGPGEGELRSFGLSGDERARIKERLKHKGKQ